MQITLTCVDFRIIQFSNANKHLRCSFKTKTGKTTFRLVIRSSQGSPLSVFKSTGWKTRGGQHGHTRLTVYRFPHHPNCPDPLPSRGYRSSSCHPSFLLSPLLITTVNFLTPLPFVHLPSSMILAVGDRCLQQKPKKATDGWVPDHFWSSDPSWDATFLIEHRSHPTLERLTPVTSDAWKWSHEWLRMDLWLEQLTRLKPIRLNPNQELSLR